MLPGQTRADLERELASALGDDLPYELHYPEAQQGGSFTDTDSPLYAACASFLDAHDPEAMLLPVICSGFADSNYLREAWGTVHRLLALPQYAGRRAPDGLHNVNERIHADDVCYAAQFLLHAARTVVG